MKTLIINAHPDPHSTLSATNQMVRHLLAKLPVEEVEVVNLAEADIQPVDKAVLDMFARTLLGEEQLDAAQTQLLARINSVTAQFKSAPRLVIALPLYNFSVPARLKDWIDNIVIPEQTFKYENGILQGLMGGHKALILQASGGVFSSGSNAQMEFTIPYLKALLGGFLGFSSVEAVRAEGTMEHIGLEAAVKQACADIDAKFEAFMAE